MTAPAATHIPKKSSCAHKAAQLIYDTGSKTDAELIAAIPFGPAKNASLALNHAFDTGWLRRLPDGRIALTDFSLDYFDAEPAKPAGKVAEPRIIDLMHREPYSPAKRLPRGDEPSWSVRVGVKLYTKA